LYGNDLCIAVSRALLLELSDATRKHADLNTFFTVLPSALIKKRETIIEEEVRSYPDRRTDTLLYYPLNTELGKQTITKWLSADGVREGRKQQRLDAQEMKRQLDSVKYNYSPSKSGKYVKEQAKDFAWRITLQWLARAHADFLRHLHNNGLVLGAEVFQSIQFYAYFIYYKYYLGNREPRKMSDFGDLFHLFYLPYCKLAVLEKDMYDILRQIDSGYKILGNMEVKTETQFLTSLGLLE